MDMVTQGAYHRQRMVMYSKEHGITAAAIRYKTSRKTLHKWRRRYDGTIDSLRDRSHRPHGHPKAHTPEEIALIRRLAKRNPKGDLLLLYERLLKLGYTRSYGGFKRFFSSLGLAPKKKRKPKRKPKPYQRADYPGQKIQIDVKYVPSYCVTNGRKYYQFTAVDECSRWTFREMYDEHSTYSAKDFLEKLVKTAPFPIRLVQTDNGTEFTNALLVIKAKHKTLFEQALEDMGIDYKRIRIATPRHNGKVERRHRTDEQRFYKHMRLYNLQDGRIQLARYQRSSNAHIMTCLGFKSPNQMLELYLHVF
jgi:transposase